jgi:uncharacterized protein YkuJ
MALQLEVAEVIDRPLAKVFHFFADEHVRNHPRWDPDIQLEQVSEGPIGVGTMIRRINSRSGAPVEGTMQVTEFEPNRAMGVVIHDGPLEMRSRVLFEALSDSRTRITTFLDIPGMDESMKGFLISRLERSSQNRKQLMESEIPIASPIVFISRNRVKPGMLDSFRKHYQDSVPVTEAGKPGTLVQVAYVSEDGTEVVIVRVFPNAEALDLQLQGADQRSKAAYQYIEPTAIEIYGAPHPYALEMMRKVAGSGIGVRISPQFIGGFSRAKSG